MATIEDGRIAAMAFEAGFRGDQLATAVAIALAESRGNPQAHNTVAPDNSYGLWQINMYGALGPARRQTYGITSNDALFDPATNAKAAYTISGGGGNWRPWTTYTSGAYRQYLDRAQAASQVSGHNAVLDVVLAPIKEVGDTVADQVTKALGDLAGPFLAGLRKIAIVGIVVGSGMALIVAGGWRGVKASG